jgi:hypothetical protein
VNLLGDGLVFLFGGRSVDGVRCSEEKVDESAGVWVVLWKVDNSVSGKSQADK